MLFLQLLFVRLLHHGLLLRVVYRKIMLLSNHLWKPIVLESLLTHNSYDIYSIQNLDTYIGNGAIVCNRVHVLDGPTESRTREKENKIRHRLAKVKAVRTA